MARLHVVQNAARRLLTSSEMNQLFVQLCNIFTQLLAFLTLFAFNPFQLFPQPPLCAFLRSLPYLLYDDLYRII